MKSVGFSVIMIEVHRMLSTASVCCNVRDLTPIIQDIVGSFFIFFRLVYGGGGRGVVEKN